MLMVLRLGEVLMKVRCSMHKERSMGFAIIFRPTYTLVNVGYPSGFCVSLRGVRCGC